MNIFGKRRIYLDYASATPVSPASLRTVREAEALIGNPSGVHEEGVCASRLLEDSRAKIAAELGCKAREIIFTSGITESNNLAILGHARAPGRTVLKGARGRSSVNVPASLENTHWLTTSVEHASVLACFEHIKESGAIVSFVNPDARGIISADAIKKELRKETKFVSVGWANNEIGVVEPISHVARMLHEYEEKNGTSIIFHSDAGQAPLYRAPQVHTLGIDLFSIGASKLYGPHGVGALFIGNRAELAPIILGGGQERGLRAGTENVALASGMSTALVEAGRERENEAKRLGKLRDYFAREIAAHVPNVIVNGDIKNMLPHILNISIPNTNAEYAVLAFDRAGIAISTKSACKTDEAVSHVLSALGGPPWRAKNTLRFSLGRYTTEKDLHKALEVLISIVSAAQSR